MTNEIELNTSHNKETDWLHRIILPCSEVMHLLADDSEQRLSGRQRIALRVHLVVCKFCARYKHQLTRLRLALRRHPAGAEVPDSPGLSPEARDRIRRSLSK